MNKDNIRLNYTLRDLEVIYKNNEEILKLVHCLKCLELNSSAVNWLCKVEELAKVNLNILNLVPYVIDELI